MDLCEGEAILGGRGRHKKTKGRERGGKGGRDEVIFILGAKGALNQKPGDCALCLPEFGTEKRPEKATLRKRREKKKKPCRLLKSLRLTNLPSLN